MTPLRFSRRLGEHYPGGTAYGCSIERFERRTPAADIALYVVAVLAVIVVCWIA